VVGYISGGDFYQFGSRGGSVPNGGLAVYRGQEVKYGPSGPYVVGSDQDPSAGFFYKSGNEYVNTANADPSLVGGQQFKMQNGQYTPVGQPPAAPPLPSQVSNTIYGGQTNAPPPPTPPVSAPTPQSNQQSQIADVEKQLNEKYRQLFEAINKGEAPASGGQARQVLNQATSNLPSSTPTDQPYQPTPQFTQVGQPVLEQYAQQAIKARNEVAEKGRTLELLKTSLSQEMGKLDLEAMNIQNIIFGTPDDIAKEISKGGGFASKAVISALSDAKSKDLLKQYNSIQMGKAAMANELGARIGLAGADLNYAQTKYETAADAMKTYESIQKTQEDKIKTLVSNVGYSGLANLLQDDPYSVSLAEKSLGLPLGTLSDPEKLKFLETYREKSLAMGQQRLQISLNNQGGQLSPESLAAMVAYTQTFGTLPPMGMGGMGARNQFWMALGQSLAESNGDFGDIAAQKSAITALNKALSTQENQYQATKTALGTLDKQLELAKKYNNKLDRSGSPAINRYLLWVKGEYAGDADTRALQNIVKTASSEFAKILSGSAASISGATVSSQKDAEDLINAYMSRGQLNAIIGLLKQESTFRLESQQETINQIKSDIGGLRSGGSGRGVNVGTVTVLGNQYEVGQIVYNSRGQKGRVEADGSITPIK
jgi:hypothetical protein